MKWVITLLVSEMLLLSSCFNSCESVEIHYPEIQLIIYVSDHLDNSFFDISEWEINGVIGEVISNSIVTISDTMHVSIRFDETLGLAQSWNFVIDYGNGYFDAFELVLVFEGTCKIQAIPQVLFVNGNRLSGEEVNDIFHFYYEKEVE